MVIHDLHIVRSGECPTETDPELIVDPDAILARPVAPQRLQPIPWRHAKILKLPGDLQLSKLPSRRRFDICESFDPSSARQSFSVGALERQDHRRQ
jgi:hypothetical protein